MVELRTVLLMYPLSTPVYALFILFPNTFFQMQLKRLIEK